MALNEKTDETGFSIETVGRGDLYSTLNQNFTAQWWLSRSVLGAFRSGESTSVVECIFYELSVPNRHEAMQ
jgi:hypothetical protein